jgi:Tol biopolymer transport system component
MAHYSYLSPDRNWVLIVEMAQGGVFQPCRLTPFDGSSAGHQVGPKGVCVAAAWSPDGKWMYFTVDTGSGWHLWRQKFPAGAPEQITSGATMEGGVAVAPDGKSIVTSLGVYESSVWIHDAGGERALSAEGLASFPQLSRDGKRVYYLRAKSGLSSTFELYSVDLASGVTSRVFPGVSLSSFQLSHDGKQVVYATGQGAKSEVWLAALDQRSRPLRIAASADQPFFGSDREVFFRGWGEKESYIYRFEVHGNARERVDDTPVVDLGGASPDGSWTIAGRRTPQGRLPDTQAIPVHGGTVRKICTGFCGVQWAPDGRYLYVSTGKNMGSIKTGKTFAIPIPPGRQLPDLPAAGIGDGKLPGVREIPQSDLSPGPNPGTYAFYVTRSLSNLYRIPLH